MILVDTSVWIDYFRGIVNEPVVKLDQALMERSRVGLTATIFQEILQGTIRMPRLLGSSAGS